MQVTTYGPYWFLIIKKPPQKDGSVPAKASLGYLIK